MFERALQLGIINKIFNIHKSEWPRVLTAWSIRFFYRVGFVVGWTIIVGLFVSRYGIAALPYLFMVNALFIIIGSLTFSTFMDRFSKEKTMLGAIFFSSFALALAIYAYPINQMVFFALLLLVEAVFLVQFRILLEGMTEEMFNPLESERTFPFIEAADTLGGIIAGLVIITLSGFIETSTFVYLWIAMLFLIIPFLLIKDYLYDDYIFDEDEKLHKHHSLIEKFREQFKNPNHLSFVLGLFAIVFLQWMLFNLLEFQYTKALYQSVSGIILEGGSGFEHTFVHDLGLLSILFSSSALIFQLIAGSRIIHNLGIIGSMILHALVTLLSLIGMVTNFGLFTTIFARNNFTVTSIIFINAYHSSYYAIGEHFREYIREIFEGFIRPLGALFGTVILISLQLLLHDEALVMGVNIALLLIAIAMLVISYLQQNKYTEAALNDLLDGKSEFVKINALNILAQKGHRNSLPVLHRLLLEKSTPRSLKLKILEALAVLDDGNSIEPLASLLKDGDIKLKNRILENLNTMRSWSKDKSSKLFAKYELLATLKRIYRLEKTERGRSLVINLISRISTMTAMDFLLSILKKTKTDLKATVILAIGRFGDEAIIKFIRPYLNSKNPQVACASAIALYQFEDYRDRCEYLVSSLLYSQNQKKIIWGLFAVGEMTLKSKKHLCLNHLKSKNREVVLRSAIALGKLNSRKAILPLVDLIISGDEVFARSVMGQLNDIDVRIRVKVDRMLKKIVSHELNVLMKKVRNESLRALGGRKLEKLKWMYFLLGKEYEAEKLSELIPKYNQTYHARTIANAC